VSLPPFQVLLDSHGGEVYRFLVATAGPVDADDCFQETAIAALRAYPQLRRGTNLRGWLLRIAHRKAIDSHRARGRRPVPVAALPEAAGDGGNPVEEASELWRAVGELPPKQRTAVYCRSVLGMPYRELAELLGSSEEAARQNVREGLRRLREDWSG
jgi:RNA polymerase sigma factor (sigma-70 family)